MDILNRDLLLKRERITIEKSFTGKVLITEKQPLSWLRKKNFYEPFPLSLRFHSKTVYLNRPKHKNSWEENENREIREFLFGDLEPKQVEPQDTFLSSSLGLLGYPNEVKRYYFEIRRGLPGSCLEVIGYHKYSSGGVLESDPMIKLCVWVESKTFDKIAEDFMLKSISIGFEVKNLKGMYSRAQTGKSYPWIKFPVKLLMDKRIVDMAPSKDWPDPVDLEEFDGNCEVEFSVLVKN